jgi:3'-5' exonuclease
MNTLVFDIETVPDVELGRRLYGLHDLDDAGVAKAMFAKQRQLRQNDFLPPPQQRVVAISVVLRSRDGLKIFSLGDEQSPERELVQRFFDGLERFAPVLVSWNGSGFDLPVLNYRALRHGINAHTYWEVGESDRDFRYNNYLSRYHWRHIDLMDVLSGYGASGRASLELAAQLIGLPGKLGIGGAQVWPAFRRGELGAIRDYCELDALNTYLIFLRFELTRGALDAATYQKELEVVEAKLAHSDRPHLKQYLDLWQTTRHAG